jgi:hypothetical protein
MPASRAALLIASASFSSRVIVTFLVAIQTPYQGMASTEHCCGAAAWPRDSQLKELEEPE